jgi:PST family polysaccharide transporter
MPEEPLHTRVIKSTTIIGGSSMVNILFRIIQAKAAALLVGTAGVGLMGVFNSALGLASLVAGMGLETSGVRQIAEAVGSEDDERIARTIIAFRRVAVLLGLLGALVFFALRYPIARLTFGNDQYAEPMGWLAVALFGIVYSTAQSTLIRGVRRIGDLARVSVFGIALGTLVGLPVLYIWRMDGIAPYLVISAGMTVFISWWYARRIQLVKVTVTWAQVAADVREMLSMGFVFMLSGLATLAVTYLVKVMILRSLGLDAAGLYEAASAVSNVYVGFVLGAMGADYFPHLSALSHDNPESNRLINAQVEVGVLAATPGILAVLALGPFFLQVLYDTSFIPAFEILRWAALGTFLRVFSWPLAYLMLARGKKSLYFWIELAANLFYLLALLGGVRWFGLPGVGIAFLMMYIFHTVVTWLAARRLSGFRWSAVNLSRLIWLLPAVLAAFLFTLTLPTLWAVLIGGMLALLVGLYSLRSLYTLVGPEVAQAYIQRIWARLGLKERGPHE